MAGLYWQPKNPALEGNVFSRPFIRFIEMVSRYLGWYAVEIPFASVPAHPLIGDLANISDASSAAPGATITGGGTNRVLGRWDGTQWVVVSGSSGGGSGVTPGAPDRAVQFNNAGNFDGSSLFTFASNRVSVDPSAAVSGNTTLAVGNAYSTGQTYAGFTSKAVFASDGNVTWQTAYVDTTSGPNYAGALSVYPESGVGVLELAGGLSGEAGFRLYPSDYPAATAAWLEIFGADVSIRGLRYPTADAPAGYVVTTDGAGTLSLQPSGPGAPDRAVQFNNAGNFDGSSLFTFASNRVSVDPSAAVSGNTTLAVGNAYSTGQTYAGFTSKAVFASDGNTTWQTAYVDTTSGPNYAGALSVYPESGVGVLELAGGLSGEAGFRLFPSDYPAATAARFEFFGADVAVNGFGLTPATFTFATLPTPANGMLANVSDSNTAVWGAVIAGGGANNVLARYNGANWTVVGK